MKYIMAFLTFVLPLGAGTIGVEKYNNNSSLQWVWGVASLKDLNLKGTESILDVGCGDGKITALLASKVPQGLVIGVEPFPELIEFAQNKYFKFNLIFEMHSALDLPYIEKFEVAISFLTLNWLQDAEAERAIYQISRALKPGGIGLITLPAPAKDASWREVMQKIMNSDEIKPYLNLFEYQNRTITIEKIQDWLAKADLNLDEISIIETPTVFSDRLDMKEWLCALNPRLWQMPSQNLDYFVDEYIRFISMIYPQAEDSRIYVFPDRMLIKISKSRD
jgi:trans-aconitate 2-methyltransferase